MKKITLVLLSALLATCCFAQEANKLTQWQFKFSPTDFQVGDRGEYSKNQSTNRFKAGGKRRSRTPSPVKTTLTVNP